MSSWQHVLGAENNDKEDKTSTILELTKGIAMAALTAGVVYWTLKVVSGFQKERGM
jgi:hypothetical protein